MEMTRLMSKTQRELPADADTVSQQLLHRAGYLRQLGAGMFSLLPLGLRTRGCLKNTPTRD
jgi:prolyl-tRNA synthetase